MRGHVYASATRALIASVASRTVTGLSPKFVIPSAKSVTRVCLMMVHANGAHKKVMNIHKHQNRIILGSPDLE